MARRKMEVDRQIQGNNTVLYSTVLYCSVCSEEIVKYLLTKSQMTMMVRRVTEIDRHMQDNSSCTVLYCSACSTVMYSTVQ